MRVTTVVIGAGHAGLAMSHCLTARSIDHVILERGEVANSWKTERWDSLRLLTPNWLSRLPGYAYHGPDPDGFRTLPETIDFIEGYAESISAPVRTRTRATSVRPSDDGYEVATEVVVTLPGLSPMPGVVRWKYGLAYGITFNRLLALSDLVAWLQDQRELLRKVG